MKQYFLTLSLFFVIAFSSESFSQDRAALDSLFLGLDSVVSDTLRADVYTNIGSHYTNVNLDSAEYYIKEALKIHERLNRLEQTVNTTIILSKVYKQKSETNRAIDVLLKMLPRLSNPNNKVLKGKCYNTLGEIYRSAEYYEKALVFLNRANTIFNDFDLEKHAALNYNRIAAVYYETKDFDLAIAYADSSLIIAKQTKDTDLIINNLDIIAATYFNLKKYDKSMLMYESIIKLDSVIIIPAHTLRNIAELYFVFNNYNKTIEYGIRAYNSAVTGQINSQIENSAILLSRAYAETNDFKKAYLFSNIAKKTYQEMFNERKNIQILELNTKYETEKKEQEIKQQKEVNKYNTLKLMQKQNENILLIAGILIAVFILVYIILQRNKTNEANKLLAIKNNEIGTKSEELNVLNESLLKLSRFKQAMTGMIVHDLKNPLNIIINSENVVYTKHAGRHMLMMVQNILDIQKYEEASLDLNINNESIYRLAENAIKQVSLLIETKSLNVTNTISKETGVLADNEKTQRVFVNLLTNAIKYTDNDGSITLSCEISKNKETGVSYNKVFVKDTGDGIPPEKLDIVFNMFEQVKPKKSGEIHSTGIGLTYCKLAVEAQGGEIGAESELDKGSVFWFTLPKGEDFITVVSAEQHQKIELNLSRSDKEYLEQYLRELKKLEVYDISESEKVLNKIDSSKSKGVAEWKSKMKNTLFITDENRFAELLNL